MIVPETFEGYFNLSSNDEGQTPPRLSVFDCVQTTVRQARDILENEAGSVVKLLVEGVRAIDEEGLDPLDVVIDPISADHPKATCSGIEGHCAILGAYYPTKTDRRRIRFALVDVCKYIRDERECYE